MAEPISSQSNNREQKLLAEVQILRQEVQRLSQANRDLKIALSTTAEHGDFVEMQLHTMNQQLKAEITDRRRAEIALNAVVQIISKQKDDLEIILQTITEHGDVLDLQWLEKLSQAHLLASFDGLTQVSNRRRFDEYLDQQWRQMAREHAPLSLILCDIDFFKQYNDTYGHLAGDDCLKIIAQAIAKTLNRPTDLLCRYGGEEFVILLPKTDVHGAATVAQYIQTTISNLKILHAQSTVSPYVTVSMGIASTLPDMKVLPHSLLDEADHYLYRAKQQGRARILYAEHPYLLKSPLLSPGGRRDE